MSRGLLFQLCMFQVEVCKVGKNGLGLAELICVPCLGLSHQGITKWMIYLSSTNCGLVRPCITQGMCESMPIRTVVRLGNLSDAINDILRICGDSDSVLNIPSYGSEFRSGDGLRACHMLDFNGKIRGSGRCRAELND